MNFKTFLFELAVIIVSLFCLFPLFTGMNSFRVLVVLSSVYIVINSFKNVFLSKAVPVFKILITLIFTIATSYIISGTTSFNFFIHISILVVFLFVYEHYRLIGIMKTRRVVLVVLGFLTVSVSQTLVALSTNPAYARLLTKNQNDVDLVGISGGYGLVYAALLALFSIVFLIQKSVTRDIRLRIFFLVLSLLIIVLVWKAGFFLALILLIAGLALTIVGIKKKNSGKNIAIVFLFSASIFLFKDALGNFAIEQTLGTKYQKKVMSVFQEDQYAGAVEGEFDERGDRYLRDLNLMLEYPIVGCWQFRLVGKHSFILDMLAQFGLVFGGFIIYYVFLIPFRLFKQAFDREYTQTFIFVSFLFIFLLLNSFAISLIPIIFIVFPFSNQMLKQSGKY